MKSIAVGFLSIVLASSSPSQFITRPEWVRLFQQGQPMPDATDVYCGIGASSSMQAEADANARMEFGLNVEVRVENVITREVRESEQRMSDEYTSSARVVSNIVLRGISITERYEDTIEKKFYALIRIPKSVYDTLLVTEIRRDLERKKAENRISEEQRDEGLRSQMVELDLRKKEEEVRKQERELQRNQYGDFLSLRAPEEVVDLRNGEIGRSLITMAVKTSFSPLDFQSAFFVLGLRRIEITGNAHFRPNTHSVSKTLEREQAAIKLQLLDQAGEFYRTSLAFGAVAYSTESTLGAFDSVKPHYSAFVGANVTIPEAYYSFASAYVDARKISLGLSNYPVPGHFKDAVSLVIQVDYVWNKEWRNRFLDPVLVQSGIRFRASDAFITSFTYENHEFLVFTVEVGL